ncbi:hypothetical protein [Acinetobacter junii]|uniref:hypothetical protein n=1 Tax=Acinetobacter junii TaxID=40215 RepID=UPI00055704F8|nr:hypothetical protein [Acinetobacter junii]
MPQYGGDNVFDLAYLRADGKLVLVEAKSNSGNISDITAFGAGKNGLGQLEKNIDEFTKMLDRQLASRQIDRRTYDQITAQLKNKTFETELYVGSRSNVPASKLKVYSDNIGKPLDRVIVMPEIIPVK